MALVSPLFVLIHNKEMKNKLVSSYIFYYNNIELRQAQ